MIYTNDRDKIRGYFFTAWNKYRNKEELNDLEQQLVEIILIHPEYHDILDNPKQYHEKNFESIDNPFMRMGLHLAVREQVSLDAPKGMTSVYQTLLTREKDLVKAERMIVDCLWRIIAETQTGERLFDEGEYMRRLRKL